MKNLVGNQKIIVLILLTVSLIFGIQATSHGFFWDLIGAIGDAAGAVGEGLGAVGEAVGIVVNVVADTVQIAAEALGLSIRVLATVFWHTDSLWSIEPFPNGGIIGVVVSNLIHLWDPLTEQTLATLKHDATVRNIAFSPDGLLLAGASDDGTLQLWNPNTETLQNILRGHTDSVLNIAFSPNGLLLASASADGTLRLWNPNTYTHQATLRGHTDSVLSVAFNPDGSLLASASADGTVRLWNPYLEISEATLRGHTDDVLDVAFSPDGLLLASASTDGTVRLWNLQTEQYQATLDHKAPVLNIAFNSDGAMLASGSEDGTARLWDPQTEKVIATLGHESPVRSVAFNSDGSILFSGSADGKMRQWEITTETENTSISVTPGDDSTSLVVRFSDFYIDFFASTAYVFQWRRKEPQGEWQEKCVEIEKGEVTIDNLDPDTTYQVRYGFNGFTCLSYSFLGRTINEGEWSAIAEGTTTESQQPNTSDAEGTTTDNQQPNTSAGTRVAFETNTPLGYRRIILSNSGTVYGIPAKYTTDSNVGKVTYMLLAKLKSCDFASAELSRSSKVYIKTQSLGRLDNYQSESICGTSSRRWSSSWNGVRVTHLRFFDERSPSNINEAIYNASTGQYELTSTTSTNENAVSSTTPETPADTDATVSISPTSVPSPAIGEQLTLNLNIAGGEAVAGYQATVEFDTTALRYRSGANGDFLAAGAFFVEPKVEGNLVRLNAVSVAGESNGDGTIATLTFEVIAVKKSTLTLSGVLLTNSIGETFVPQLEDAEITEPTALKGDVNGDGTVNIADLVLVASNLGKTGQNTADVNGDGQINIADLVLVAGALGTSAAAPSLLPPDALEMLTSADVRLWLSAAQHLDLTHAASQRGVLFLEQLFAVLIPKETALLANYPNPFNPETWIPYQLANSADVRLTIYAIDGQVVRRLALGHQPAGIYQNRSRAAYWDGRNAFGESVASGVYFYTLTAGDFSATRKMLIRK